jgi:hypothetical protein
LSIEKLALPVADDVFSVYLDSLTAKSGELGRSSPSSSVGGERLRPVTHRLRQQIQLGQQTFELVLGDESAKANLNRIALECGDKSAEDVLSAVVPPGFSRCVWPRLNTSSSFTGWGAIFSLAELQRQHGTARVIVEASKDLSIWGSGELNIHRAPNHVLQAVCGAIVPQGRADRLVKVMQDSPAELEVILQRAVKNEQEQTQLRRLLSDGSSTFSLWIESRHASGASDLSLAVRAINAEGIVTNYHFWLY